MLAGTSPDRNKGGEGGIPGCTGWSQQNHMGTGEKERKFSDLFKRIFQVNLGGIKSFESKRLNVVAHYIISALTENHRVSSPASSKRDQMWRQGMAARG